MELKEYIAKLKNLEISCYEQSQYIQQLKDTYNRVVNPCLYAKVNAEKTKKLDGWSSFVWVIFCTIVGLVVAVYKTEYIYADGRFFPDFQYKYILWGIGIGFAIFAYCLINRNLDQDKLNQVARKENEIRYEKNDKILKLVPQKAQMIKVELAKAESKYNETYMILQEYYNKGIIFEKYRGLVPICMFHEYLQSGRCEQLTGHEGAYNIYENELRMNIIINKLNDIIERLDSIEENQYVIAQAIRGATAEVNKLSNLVNQQISTLQNIDENAALTAYYSKITAVNTTYMAWIKKYKIEDLNGTTQIVR